MRIVQRPVGRQEGKQRTQKRGHDTCESESCVDRQHACPGRGRCGIIWHDGFRTSRCGKDSERRRLECQFFGRTARGIIRDALQVLTKLSSVGKVVQGRANDPFLLPALRWEVVQLAVHQILDLIILVRVQASQPIFSMN